MSVFRRRPDADLPGLDVGAANRLRSVVEESLTAMGIDADVSGDHATTATVSYTHLTLPTILLV